MKFFIACILPVLAVLITNFDALSIKEELATVPLAAATQLLTNLAANNGTFLSVARSVSKRSTGCKKIWITKFLKDGERINGYSNYKLFEIGCQDPDSLCGTKSRCKQLFVFYDGYETRNGKRMDKRIPIKVGCTCHRWG